MKAIIFVCLILFMKGILPAHAQVLMKEYLTQTQSGIIEQSVNWPGKKLYYKLRYDSLRTVSFEQYSTTRYYYTLMIANNSAFTNAIEVPGMVRDLVITTYFEFYFDNGAETKTFTLTYDKNNKWYRIKFAPQWGCRREELWKRVDGISSYEQLLKTMISQMDNNLKLDCYVGKKAKTILTN